MAPKTQSQRISARVCPEYGVGAGRHPVDAPSGRLGLRCRRHGGPLWYPRIVNRIQTGEGRVLYDFDSKVRKKLTIEDAHLDLIRRGLWKAVNREEGTASDARLDDVDVAGKTGTAQKYIEGRYRTEYRSSFVGFFPAENPKYVCLIVMDEPQVYPPYGGYVAGPIFRETAKRIAGLDNEIEKQIIEQEQRNDVWAYAPDLKGLTKNEATALLKNQRLAYSTSGNGDWIATQNPQPGTELTPKDEITLELTNAIAITDTTEMPDGYSIIPDVGGMSMRKATTLINSRGFEAEMIGSGTVYTQFPRPGDMMKQGRTITVRGKAKALETLTTSGATE